MRILSSALVGLSIFMSTVAFAQTTTYGRWRADLSNSPTLTEAATTNESGSLFGFICLISENRCTYYFSAHTTCVPGVASTILINTDTGALTSTTACIKVQGNYYSSIQDTTGLHNAVMSSQTIGIAIPMESGQFKVIRFSLSGANSAISLVAKAAAELEKTSDHYQ